MWIPSLSAVFEESSSEASETEIGNEAFCRSSSVTPTEINEVGNEAFCRSSSVTPTDTNEVGNEAFCRSSSVPNTEVGNEALCESTTPRQSPPRGKSEASPRRTMIVSVPGRLEGIAAATDTLRVVLAPLRDVSLEIQVLRWSKKTPGWLVIAGDVEIVFAMRRTIPKFDARLAFEGSETEIATFTLHVVASGSESEFLQAIFASKPYPVKVTQKRRENGQDETILHYRSSHTSPTAMSRVLEERTGLLFKSGDEGRMRVWPNIKTEPILDSEPTLCAMMGSMAKSNKKKRTKDVEEEGSRKRIRTKDANVEVENVEVENAMAAANAARLSVQTAKKALDDAIQIAKKALDDAIEAELLANRELGEAIELRSAQLRCYL